MSAVGRADAVARNHAADRLPARWIDLTEDADAALSRVATVLGRHGYVSGEPSGGVQRFRFGSPALEFVSDALALGLLLRLAGRPDGWAEVVAWCEPTPGGVRLSISLVEGVFHALLVRGAITELIEQCRQDGSLITAGEAMSGLDLPLDSPGRPTRHGGRR